MLDLCNTKKDHLYQRYFCKKCDNFHMKEDLLYLKHKDFKVNRYFCIECNHTHISSRGNKFIEHFKDRGKEISFYGSCCAIKCNIKKHNNITITDDQAKKLLVFQQAINGLSNEIWDAEISFTFDEAKRQENLKKLNDRYNEIYYKFSLYKIDVGIR